MTRQRERFCPKCGHAASSSEKFCANCGSHLTGGRENQKIVRHKGGFRDRKNWIWVVAVSVAAVFFITFVIVGMNSGKQKNVDIAHNNILIKDTVAAFDCGCGSCEKRLLDCDCPTAKEEVKFIENLVADGRDSPKEIIDKVAERYGKLINNRKPKG